MGEAALAVFRTIGLSVYARADFIVTEDGTPYFLEINTLPGMTPTSWCPRRRRRLVSAMPTCARPSWRPLGGPAGRS